MDKHTIPQVKPVLLSGLGFTQEDVVMVVAHNLQYVDPINVYDSITVITDQLIEEVCGPDLFDADFNNLPEWIHIASDEFLSVWYAMNRYTQPLFNDLTQKNLDIDYVGLDYQKMKSAYVMEIHVA